MPGGTGRLEADALVFFLLQVVFTELCNMLDPGKPVFTPKKGKPNVVMFVELQGQSDSPTNLACLLCLLFYTYY